MDISQMHIAVKLGLDKTEGLTYAAFEPEEIDAWLNEAIDRYVKTRYSGINPKQESFEQSQKRTDDLRTLVSEEKIDIDTTPSIIKGITYLVSTTTTVVYNGVTYNDGDTFTGDAGVVVVGVTPGSTTSWADVTDKPNSYVVAVSDFPSDYMLFLNDEVSISFSHEVTGTTTTLRTFPIVCNSDTYSTSLQDPYSEHILHLSTARPLRMFSKKGIELITDGQYTISSYYLKYLRKPARVNYALTDSQTTGIADIAEGITYIVSVADVIYNSITYSVGEVFTGVLSVTTFTGFGTATAQVADCDLSEHTHREIVLSTVNLLAENIESPRYQTGSVELMKNE